MVALGASAQADRCRGEDGKTRHENPLRADAVAERARGENEGGKRDGVGADNPLQLRDAAAQRRADAVERGVDDGDVELNHAIAEAHGRQRQRRREVRTGPVSFSGRESVPAAGNGWNFREVFRMGHLNSRNQRGTIVSVAAEHFGRRSKCHVVPLQRQPGGGARLRVEVGSDAGEMQRFGSWTSQARPSSTSNRSSR